MSKLETNLRNRSWILDRLRAEIIGPDCPDKSRATLLPSIEDSSPVVFEGWDEFRRPKLQSNGQEILWQDAPIKRYGAGMLFPFDVTERVALDEEAKTTPTETDDAEVEIEVANNEELEKEIEKFGSSRGMRDAGDSDDYDVNLANAWRPSALGLSFLADFDSEAAGVVIHIESARYIKVDATVRRSQSDEDVVSRDLWYRVPLRDSEDRVPSIRITTEELRQTHTKIEKKVPGNEESGLCVSVVSRRHALPANPNCYLLTICLVNRVDRSPGRLDEQTYFQCRLKIGGVSGAKWVLPYPEAAIKTVQHPEELVTRLLYRDRLVFGIGHGCAVEWKSGAEQDKKPAMASSLWTECLPSFETPSISPEIADEKGAPIRVSMYALAGMGSEVSGFDELQQLIDAYRNWIRRISDLDNPREVQQKVLRPPIPSELKVTAQELIDRCNKCLERMEDGLSFLQSDSRISEAARHAFRLANEVMYLAQLRRSRSLRVPKWDSSSARYSWDNPIKDLDLSRPHRDRGFWRPFQIAFLLMSLEGVCKPEDRSRETVDLIWFPTGGGKTEAYLGLTAFLLFFNRLLGQLPAGVEVIMRYTLRLLTTQQFERAGLLFCCLEHVRKAHISDHPMLHGNPFKLGMWVGGEASPNTHAEALSALNTLEKNPDAENPFVLLRCPWCGAKMGPHLGESEKRRGGRRSSTHEVLGYKKRFIQGTRKKSFYYRCEDPSCEFGGDSELPISVIDQDIYAEPPSLIIGTVDKFALLSWNSDARGLFGFDEHGDRQGLPPSLIIQDEIHLISGPLGSMVGIFEPIIEELCASRRGDQVIRPKIIASTATISRATEQVQALYGREQVELFPPSGLEAGDSFFAREDRDESGGLRPGRLYAGVMAPGHGSQQTTQARVYAALLQYPAMMDIVTDENSERDPWWTLLCFYNSLRELGGASTLFVADSRDYLRVILNRHGFPYDSIRQLLNWDELTSRIRSDQIPKRIQQLEIPFQRDSRGYVKDTVDACLASNIIEVGIDIDRLGLMAIVGQPKTTSQYIQVSSRIGRNPEAPGLVAVVYSSAKPRDRSHFERFRPYHQRLYAQVEPTSVTPFSPPAVDRALHGVLVAAVRQLGTLTEASDPRPFPLAKGSDLRRRIEGIINQRVTNVDSGELASTQKRLQQRMREWEAWNPSEYGGFGSPPVNAPLMHPAGSHAREDWNEHSWPTMSSLRNVDAACEAEITNFYNELPDDGDEG